MKPGEAGCAAGDVRLRDRLRRSQRNEADRFAPGAARGVARADAPRPEGAQRQ